MKLEPKEKKAWTVTRIKNHKHPKLTVRVGEFRAGGTVYVFWWEGKRQHSQSLGCKRSDMGKGKAAQEKTACAKGAAFIEALAARAELGDGHTDERKKPLTLQGLLDHYERDGLLRASQYYRRDAVACVRRTVEFLGGDKAVVDIMPKDVERYLAQRIKAGRAPAGRRDMVALGIACNWAKRNKLVQTNPLDDARKEMMIPHQPSRPFRTKEDYEAMRAVAAKVKAPEFPVLLALAWHTGHRISAILGLRWEHVQLAESPGAPHGAITWYAECVTPDRKKHRHTVELNVEAHNALVRWRAACGPMPVGFLFPAAKDPKRPMDSSRPKVWLREAEDLAGLPHQKQGGWHQFRRSWATSRKGMPIHDVARAGGWTDHETILKCYQQPTTEATRSVALFVA